MMFLYEIMVAFGLLAFHATGFVQCEKLHELLTDEEFSKVFRTTRDNVPEYEVVPVMHNLYKRSSEHLRMAFSAFGRDFDIHLDPHDGVLAGVNTPIWLASPGSNGKVNYNKMKVNAVELATRSFRSRRSDASVVVDQSTDNKPRFEGTIDDVTIVSWPNRVQNVTKDEFERLKREVPSPSRTLIPTDYHVIIRSKASLSDSTASAVKQVDEIVQRYNETDNHRTKRFTNDVIYPSILVVTDYSGTQTTQDESQFYDDIRYQLAFWNAVDLRYRDMESPKVRLRIAGIIIGQGRAATPYVNNFMNGGTLNVYGALNEMVTYWKAQTSNKDFIADAYDVVMTITDAKMYNPKNSKEFPIGLASIGSLCEPSLAVGFVTDDTKFEGILTATHELGHILGAGHDPTTDSLHGGACAERHGYIMAPRYSKTPKMNHWSSCSLRIIQNFLGQNKNCADEPAGVHHPGTPIRRIAPGDIHSAQQQCENHGFSYTCDPTPKTCAKLQCWLAGFRGLFSSHGTACQDAPKAALDGTPCASGAICVRGECRKGNQVIH